MKQSAVGKFKTAYNKKHGITPQTIQKEVREVIEATKVAEQNAEYVTEDKRRK